MTGRTVAIADKPSATFGHMSQGGAADAKA